MKTKKPEKNLLLVDFEWLVAKELTDKVIESFEDMGFDRRVVEREMTLGGPMELFRRLLYSSPTRPKANSSWKGDYRRLKDYYGEWTPTVIRGKWRQKDFIRMLDEGYLPLVYTRGLYLREEACIVPFNSTDPGSSSYKEIMESVCRYYSQPLVFTAEGPFLDSKKAQGTPEYYLAALFPHEVKTYSEKGNVYGMNRLFYMWMDMEQPNLNNPEMPTLLKRTYDIHILLLMRKYPAFCSVTAYLLSIVGNVGSIFGSLADFIRPGSVLFVTSHLPAARLFSMEGVTSIVTNVDSSGELLARIKHYKRTGRFPGGKVIHTMEKMDLLKWRGVTKEDLCMEIGDFKNSWEV